jgi:hypothetical protein
MRALAGRLERATLLLSADDDAMLSCAVYACLGLEKVWPVLPASTREAFASMKLRLESPDSQVVAGMFADMLLLDLVNFLRNTLFPDYCRVWISLKQAERHIIETATGDVFQALEDIQLTFQLSRHTMAASDILLSSWTSTLLCRSLDERPTVTEFWSNLSQENDCPAVEDLSDFHRSLLVVDPGTRRVIPREIQVAAFLQFEAHAYNWFAQNVYVAADAAVDDPEEESPDGKEEAIPGPDELDPSTRQLVTDAGWCTPQAQITYEYVATVIYIAGAAMSRCSRWCQEMAGASRNSEGEREVSM